MKCFNIKMTRILTGLSCVVVCLISTVTHATGPWDAVSSQWQLQPLKEVALPVQNALDVLSNAPGESADYKHALETIESWVSAE